MAGLPVVRRIRNVGLVVGGSALVWAALAIGCGPGAETLKCDENGCQTCDGYGCRPADPTPLPDASTKPDTTQPPTGCGVSEETCDNGLQCIDGMCLSPCEYSSQCGPGRICVNSKCVAGCDGTTTCPAGYKCSSKGACEPDTSDPQCSTSKPCPGGLKCVSGLCQGGCVGNGDCLAGEICDPTTASCVPDPQPKPPCQADPSVCASSQVCSNGYCRYPCTDSDVCAKIDVRIAVCKGGICMSDAEANPKCTKKEDCAAGQDCVSNVCM
jgi:hypothetical protein